MTSAPYSVSSTDDLERARLLMARHSIRHLPVIDGSELVGVLVERELEVLDALPRLSGSHILVSRAMRPAVSVSGNVTLDEAVDLMVENELDCLVVRSASGLVEGVFTAVDVLESVARIARRVARTASAAVALH